MTPEQAVAAMNRRPAEALNAAANLLSRPGAWTQGAMCRDANGIEPEWEPSNLYVMMDAASWCMVGALKLESVGDCNWTFIPAARALRALTKADLRAWNDDPDRTQLEVVNLLRQAARSLA